MDKKQQIILKVKNLLKEKNKTIRNKNAIEQLIAFFGFGELYNIFFGIKDKLEFEKYKLTLDELLDLIVTLDNPLNGLENKSKNNKINILLENIISKGNVTGFEGSTSNPQVKKIFQDNPIDISLKSIVTNGNVTGIKLNVDDEAELKQPLNIQNDNCAINFNPKAGKIIFGAKH